MLIGTREVFEYIQCAKCRCIQIANIPADLARHYPEDYYSFRHVPEPFWRSFLKRRVASYRIGGKVFPGKLLAKALRVPALLERVARSKAGFDSNILDVGCGAGRKVLDLHRMGFTNISGVDPYIHADMEYENGVKIRKMAISEVEGEFDLVILHDSFEHMPEPLMVLREAHRILKANGTVLLRTPVADCFAWREYGVDWVQLDAPRHLFIHSRRSMKHLVEQARLVLSEVVYDSTSFQFWGSELYRKDIPLRDPRSYAENPNGSVISKQDIKRFERMAAGLNAQEEGDSASFYLCKT
jgi:2-polyprenyl-3-methyl-5-hydroxy-6-metoxy-1,4-benzoquinol methylase